MQGNILSNNYYGIYLKKSRKNLLSEKSGIKLISSRRNSLSNNFISDNERGIFIGLYSKFLECLSDYS
ncbi:NosD domain-containing protein [Methanosarcina horonobensis]|uniref:NosD domain-containing protein n=1 Tax=Methanosarcina horonobensis TaxID=418008 RepID=UPI0009E40134